MEDCTRLIVGELSNGLRNYWETYEDAELGDMAIVKNRGYYDIVKVVGITTVFNKDIKRYTNGAKLKKALGSINIYEEPFFKIKTDNENRQFKCNISVEPKSKKVTIDTEPINNLSEPQMINMEEYIKQLTEARQLTDKAFYSVLERCNDIMKNKKSSFDNNPVIETTGENLSSDDWKITDSLAAELFAKPIP